MRLFIYIVCLMFVFSCDSVERPKKPDNLIPKDKMVDIMYEVFILNATKGVNKQKLESNGIFPEDYLFKKYNIDSLQFALSNNYYAYDIKVYEKIINDIKLKIETNKAKYEDLSKEEIKKADDLRKQQEKKADTIVRKIEAFAPVKN